MNRPIFTSLGPFLVFGVYLFLLLKILLVFLLSQLFDFFRAHQVIVKNTTVIADLVNIAISHRFLVC